MDKININAHSSIQIENLYFDPYHITENIEPAKIVFVTHTHYDHLSIEDIKKVISDETILVATADARQTLEKEFPVNKKIFVLPNQNFTFNDIEIETFPAYNIDKQFHRRENNWVGYKITHNGTRYAVVGDSDFTPELKTLKCDVLFVPIGGTFTMTALEAAELANTIKPKLVIPTHYNLIVGTKDDEKVFIDHLSKDIEYKILI